MTEPAVLGRPLWHEAALLGGRIAKKLREQGEDGAGGQGHGRGPGEALPGSAPASAGAGGAAESSWGRVLRFFDSRVAQALAAAPPPAPQPLDELALALHLSGAERALLVLAGMADEHEGYGAAFAALHPRAESRPTWGLFAWLASKDEGRNDTLALLHRSALFRLGLVRLVGDAPLPERSLRLADGLWSALHGLPAWPEGLAPLDENPWLAGLDDWLDQPDTRMARSLLDARMPAIVLLRGLQPQALRLRAQQLAAACGGWVFEWDAAREPAALSALLGPCLLRQALPVLLAEAALPPAHWALLDALLAASPLPLVLAGSVVGQAALSRHPILMLDAPPLAPAAQSRLWQRALPELAGHAELLTARYPVGPDTLVQLRRDLSPWLGHGGTPSLERCVAALKARMARADESFARRLLPTATWADLVLPPEKLAPLQDAVARMQWQRRVLDDWGFGLNHRGRRGLRLLFSGLPGTGKTLAAEVVAHALHADLLVIDLARLVSKWVGETEKNLAAAFDQAEGTGAVLFFDEADALFGKRTEVGDAHDRYANIESAYLLARLERFDGVAILATNLRANLDRAFLRRFEVALDFAEPGPTERAAIWRRQFPPQAPLDDDLDVDALAALHPLPGALIRNAALGAAFIAAAEDGRGDPACDGGQHEGHGPAIGAGTGTEPGNGKTQRPARAAIRIQRRHVERALRQEYDKSGRVNPL